MKHHQILVAVVLFLISVLGLSGCEDPDAAEKEAILASLRQLDQANIDCNGAAAVAVMSSKGIAAYTRLVNLALDGTRVEVLGLEPSELMQVLQLRNRLTRAQLEQMDGADYQEYATSECWYVAEDSEDVSYVSSIDDIKVYGDLAHAAILDEDGKDSGLVVEFAKEDGVWKVNEFCFHRLYDEYLYSVAAQEDMEVAELLVLIEEMDWGNDIRRSIWEPMR
ncbi:MAG: hypothetical protein ACF8R9_01120 [Phycisphaerales bacterium JB054]